MNNKFVILNPSRHSDAVYKPKKYLNIETITYAEYDEKSDSLKIWTSEYQGPQYDIIDKDAKRLILAWLDSKVYDGEPKGFLD